MLLLLLHSVLFLILGYVSAEPSLKAWFSQAALDTFVKAGNSFISYEQNIKLDTKASFIHLGELQNHNFTFDARFEDSKIFVPRKNGLFILKGTCDMKVVSPFPVDISIMPNAEVSMGIKEENGFPVVEVLHCDAFPIVGIMENSDRSNYYQFFRKIVNWIIKWVAPDFGSMICSKLSSFVEEVLNPQIRQALLFKSTAFEQVTIAVGPKLALPPDIRKDSFALDFNLNPMVISNKDQSVFECTPNVSSAVKVKPSPHMCYFMVDEQLLNCFVDVLKRSGMMNVSISRKSVEDETLKQLLRTTCSGEFCVGSIFENLGKNIPNRDVGLEIYPMENSPSISLTSAGPSVSVKVAIRLHVDAEYVGELNLDLSAKILPVFEGNSIKASLKVRNISVTTRESKFGKVEEWSLRSLASGVETVINVQSGMMLGKGFELPEFLRIQIANSSAFEYFDKKMVLNMDLKNRNGR